VPKLTIDGRPVEVPDGTRVIQAARQLGIAIPTMCYIEGLEPFTSCMICQVKNDANGKMIPGCSAPVEEGMAIVTLSDEVKKARKFTLELLFSDHVGDCEAPCQRVCKSHINNPSMIRHNIDDDLDGAVEVLREAAGPTNLPCHGCEGTCEPGCRRGKAEAPIAIRDLVTFVHKYGDKNNLFKPEEAAGVKLEKRFNCAIGKLKEGEIDLFVADAYDPKLMGRIEPANVELGFTIEEAKKEGSRCMHCDCRKAETCSLRDYADLYGVKQREYQPDDRSRHQQIRQHGDIMYEPEKCIKCGLCIRITELKKETLGLTWIGRGFDVTVATPFNAEISTAVTTTAADCVDACPTAALSYFDHHAERKANELRGRIAQMGQAVVGAVSVPVSWGSTALQAVAVQPLLPGSKKAGGCGNGGNCGCGK
jgi:ferredoxin